MYAEFQREKEDLLESIRMLQDQMQLKDMVIEAFIPPEETQKVRMRSFNFKDVSSMLLLIHIPKGIICAPSALSRLTLLKGDAPCALGRGARGVGPGAAERCREARRGHDGHCQAAGLGLGAAQAHVRVRKGQLAMCCLACIYTVRTSVTLPHLKLFDICTFIPTCTLVI